MRSTPTAVTAPARLGEGPLWDDDRSTLLWLDILGNAVHEYDPKAGQDVSVTLDVPVGAIAKRHGGGYLVAAGMGFAVYEWPGTHLEWVTFVDHGKQMNDGKCDPAGRFVAGTLVDEDHPGQGVLYQLEGDTVRQLLDNVTISNGLGWSPSGQTMYYVDTPLERIDAFDYDPATGGMTGRRVFADLRDVPGRPDGLAVDAEGGVWVAMARGGAAVRRFTSDGRLDDVLPLPVPNVTSVAFGGEDLGDLYVTTSQLRLTGDDLRRWPSSGSLFRAPAIGVRGLPSTAYRHC